MRRKYHDVSSTPDQVRHLLRVPHRLLAFVHNFFLNTSFALRNQHVWQVVTIAHSLGRLQSEHGLPVDPSENVKLNLNFGLVDVVYEWARGVPFCEITQVCVQEKSYSRKRRKAGASLAASCSSSLLFTIDSKI